MGNRYSNVKPGKAKDLGDDNYYRSGWERDVARFLNLMQEWGVVVGWDYEPMDFSFQGLGYKRGPFTYKPDFAVHYSHSIPQEVKEVVCRVLEVKPGKTLFIEVKGQEKGSDRNKWRRFRKHSGYELDVINREKLLKIQAGFKPLIENWESNVRP